MPADDAQHPGPLRHQAGRADEGAINPDHASLDPMSLGHFCFCLDGEHWAKS